MNGKTDIDSEQYETGCNFVIGGNTLGRGVTFPGLQTIYYTRTSKNPQADTMWQHSRMFGYDTRIFKEAIEHAELCSNDPVCITSKGQGRESLNLASCHACGLIPETSCEIYNIMLDRGLVVLLKLLGQKRQKGFI